MRLVQGYLGCREGPYVTTDLSAASGASRSLVNGTRLMRPMDEGYAGPLTAFFVLGLAW